MCNPHTVAGPKFQYIGTVKTERASGIKCWGGTSGSVAVVCVAAASQLVVMQ